MKETTTYECRKCGNRFVVSGKGKEKLVPLYCCGEDITKKKKKVTVKRTVIRKKTSKKN